MVVDMLFYADALVEMLCKVVLWAEEGKLSIDAKVVHDSASEDGLAGRSRQRLTDDGSLGDHNGHRLYGHVDVLICQVSPG